MSQIYISDVNPNDDTGGGGTLANGETRSEDATGPYVVFSAVETSSNISPHAVLAFNELKDAVTLLDDYTTAQVEEVIEVPDEDVVEVEDETPDPGI